MTTRTEIDARNAQMYVVVRFEDENWTEDVSGGNGPESKASAEELLAPFMGGPDPEVRLMMHLEDVAATAIYAAIGKKQDRAPNGLGRGFYDDFGLSVFIPIDKIEDVAKVRNLLDRDGRSYDLAPYVEVCDPILFPIGVNGPALKLNGSSRSRPEDGDLDEWLEEHEATIDRAESYSLSDHQFPGVAVWVLRLPAEDGHRLSLAMDKAFPGSDCEWFPPSNLLEVRPTGFADDDYAGGDYAAWAAKEIQIREAVEKWLQGARTAEPA